MTIQHKTTKDAIEGAALVAAANFEIEIAEHLRNLSMDKILDIQELTSKEIDEILNWLDNQEGNMAITLYDLFESLL